LPAFHVFYYLHTFSSISSQVNPNVCKEIDCSDSTLCLNDFSLSLGEAMILGYVQWNMPLLVIAVDMVQRELGLQLVLQMQNAMKSSCTPVM
jgi:hypothetical protein